MDKYDYIGKVVTFTPKIEEMECNADPIQKARIRDLEMSCDDPDLLEHIYRFVFDYSEFEDHNDKFDRANFYDKNGFARLTAKQAGQYKESEIVYFGTPELWPFEHYFIIENEREFKATPK
jgi:hypothetical protein